MQKLPSAVSGTGKQITLIERARCFHPAKGFYSVLIGMSPFLILAILLALMAREQVYTLGGLPSWVKSFETRADIGLALAYYHENISVGLVGVLRIIIRLLLFPYINMIGTDSAKGLLLLEQMSPLVILIIPMLYALGYLRGPDLRARVHGSLKADSKRRKYREQKARAQRKQPRDMV